MKKLSEINGLLSREEMKQVQGGNGRPDYESNGGGSGGGWQHWVSCTDGGTYQVLDCDGWAEGFCISLGETMTSCSSWNW